MRPSLAAAIVMSLATGSLNAQAEPRRVGLGMAITSIGTGGTYGIYVPLALSSRVRLEPEVAFSASAYTISSLGTQRDVESQSVWLGVGLLLLSDAGTDTKVYFGPRGGIAWTHQQSTDQASGNSEAEAFDWFAAIAAGAEHFLAPRFSLGGEVRLGFYHAGDSEGTGLILSGASRLTTGAAAFVRWYL